MNDFQQQDLASGSSSDQDSDSDCPDKENEKKRLRCGNYSRDKQLLQNAIVCSMTTDSKSKHSVRFKSEMCGISKSAFSRKEKNLKKEQKKWATANSKDEKCA